VPFRGYLAASVGGVSGEVGEVRLVPLGRSWITGHGGGGNDSPSWLKMARIASASASVMRNIPKAW
jgi:hypothetical protein